MNELKFQNEKMRLALENTERQLNYSSQESQKLSQKEAKMESNYQNVMSEWDDLKRSLKDREHELFNLRAQIQEFK